MSDGDHPPTEEAFAGWLLAFDEALKKGEPLSPEAAEVVEANPHLQQARNCLQLLEQKWPRGNSSFPSPATASDSDQPPSEAIPFSMPERLGRFRLVRELGRGGCGIVYLAIDSVLDRQVALKVPHAAVLLDPKPRERFLREARAAAGLDHPNVVRVWEAGTVGPVCYIASAYCEGVTLADWITERSEPVPARDAAALLATLAEAMHYTHGRGILHRDLKPANVLLSFTRPAPRLTECLPRITDFGLAKLFDGALETESAGGKTRSGTILGTPRYMAPEQARGHIHEMGPHTDVYMLGVIFYEVLTGQPPVQGCHDLDTLKKVLADEPVPPRRLRPDLPRDLQTICLRCLEKAPRSRYLTAGQLAEDLRRWLAGEPIHARRAGLVERSWKWARRRPTTAVVLGIGILMVLGLLGGAGALLRFSARAELEQRRLVYVNHVADAGRAWERGDRATLAELLNGLRPAQGQPDLRGFEWHCLWQQYRDNGLHLYGHKKPITCLAWSSDGSTLASVGAHEPVRLWDPATGQLRALLSGHPGNVCTAAFLPDNRTLVTADDDGRVLLWDVATGSVRETVAKHDQGINCFAFSPDGRLLAYGGGLGVFVWDTAAHTERVCCPAHTGSVYALAFTPDGRTLASGDAQAVYLWDCDTWQRRATLPEPTHLLWSLTFSPDGRLLAGGNWEGSVRVWDAATGEVRAVVAGTGHCVFRTAFTPGGKSLMVGGDRGSSKGGVVQMWDVATFLEGGAKNAASQPWATLELPVNNLRGLALSPDGRDVALGGDNGLIRFWHPRRPGEEPLPMGHQPEEVWAVAFAPDGRTLVSGGDNATGAALLRSWDVTTGMPLWASKGHEALVSCVAFSADGRFLASGSYDCTVKLWEPAMGQELATLSGHSQAVRCLALSSDGRLLAAGCNREGLVYLWDVETRQLRRTLVGHTDAVRALAFAPDGKRLVTASEDETVRLWEIATGQEVGHFADTSEILAVVYSPDGESLAWGNRAGRVTLRDLKSGKQRTLPTGHAKEVRALAFTPDGRTLASAGADQVIRLWEPVSGLELLALRGHVQAINSLAFSPHGNCLASASHDGAIRLWRAADAGKCR